LSWILFQGPATRNGEDKQGLDTTTNDQTGPFQHEVETATQDKSSVAGNQIRSLALQVADVV
jgi:hypothetical protein